MAFAEASGRFGLTAGAQGLQIAQAMMRVSDTRGTDDPFPRSRRTR